MEKVNDKTFNSLQKRFQPTSVHLVGLFLSPPFKELSFLPDETKNHALETVKSMMFEIYEIQKDTIDDFQEFLDTNQPKKI